MISCTVKVANKTIKTSFRCRRGSHPWEPDASALGHGALKKKHVLIVYNWINKQLITIVFYQGISKWCLFIIIYPIVYNRDLDVFFYPIVLIKGISAGISLPELIFNINWIKHQFELVQFKPGILFVITGLLSHKPSLDDLEDLFQVSGQQIRVMFFFWARQDGSRLLLPMIVQFQEGDFCWLLGLPTQLLFEGSNSNQISK